MPDGHRSGKGLVAVEVFEISDTLHADFDMPVLRKHPGVSETVTVLSEVRNDVYCIFRTVILIRPLQKVLFHFNAQHDCRPGRCLPTAFRPQMQERMETARTVQLIQHEGDDHFVINMTSLHNAAQLRKVLPRNLTAPKPLYSDRKARHFEIAMTLRVTQAEKRERTKAKSKATREAKKAKKPQQVPQIRESDEGSDSETDEGSDEEDGMLVNETRTGAKRRRTRL
jgi:hypothetical protein